MSAMEYINRLIFRFNDKITRKNFTHEFGDIRLTVAEPEEFFKRANENDWNVFEMQCLQSYVQGTSGKWVKSLVVAFKNKQDLNSSKVTEISQPN